MKKQVKQLRATREMAGQAPYVVNAGIAYGNVENGINAGVFYNVSGPALEIVGGGLFPDVYQESFHSLNLSINKKLGEKQKTVVDLKVSNLLNDKRESVYKSYKATDQVFSRLNPGMSIGVGVSHKF